MVFRLTCHFLSTLFDYHQWILDYVVNEVSGAAIVAEAQGIGARRGKWWIAAELRLDLFNRLVADEVRKRPARQPCRWHRLDLPSIGGGRAASRPGGCREPPPGLMRPAGECPRSTAGTSARIACLRKRGRRTARQPIAREISRSYRPKCARSFHAGGRRCQACARCERQSIPGAIHRREVFPPSASARRNSCLAQDRCRHRWRWAWGCRTRRCC